MKFFAALFLTALAFTTANAQFSGQYFTRIAGKPIYTYDYLISDSVENVRTKLQDTTGISPLAMDLFHNGQQMFDGHTLEDYGMVTETSIYVYPSLRPTGILGDTVWSGGTDQNVSLADYAGGTLSVSSFEIDGLLDLSSASASIPITLSLLTSTFGVPVALQNFDPMVSAVWTLVTTTGGVAGYTPGQFAINTSGFIDAPGEGSFSVALSQDGQDLNLIYTVPEPGTVGLIGLGMGCLLLRRRVIRS